jgi:hypothetical protein
MKNNPKLVSSTNIKMFVPRGFRYTETLQSKVSHDLLSKSLTVEQVSNLLKIEVHTLQNRISEGKNFPPHFQLKGGRKRYFPVEWLDLYLSL